jgi:hypothetical protein
LWKGTPMSSAMSFGVMPLMAFTTAAMPSTLEAIALVIW